MSISIGVLNLRCFHTALPAVALGACLGFTACSGSHSDQNLTTDIQAKLYADTLTKASNIGVAVHNGVVTLTGDVSDPNVALEAMKIANNTSGVKSVDDKMTVNGESASATLPGGATSASAPAPGAQPPEQAAAPQNAPEPPPAAPAPPPEPVTVTVPAGEHLQVRLIDSIDSSRDRTGQTFRATLYAPLIAGSRVAIPAGAPVTILLAQDVNAGRIKGRAELELRVTGIDYRGHRYPVDSSFYEAASGSRGKQTAERTGIGAAAGAVIGALAGGGKGAAIGSAIGGGGGFGVNLLTHGPAVKIPSETVLTFRLKAPLTVTK
jgi:hypothetical protein